MGLFSLYALTHLANRRSEESGIIRNFKEYLSEDDICILFFVIQIVLHGTSNVVHFDGYVLLGYFVTRLCQSSSHLPAK